MMGTGIPVRWRPRLWSLSSLAARCRVARSTIYKNNRPVATCLVGKDDLQALMVGAGWAWAYTAFSDEYVDASDGRQHAGTRIIACRRGSGGR
jgi:hypothetical protein